MTRLSKTQIQILAAMAESESNRFVVSSGLRLGGVKPRSWGSREFKAAMGLVERDLATMVSRDSYMDCNPSYSDHFTEMVITLNKVNDDERE